MTAMEWAVRPLKRYVDFSGRAPRAEYWWFYLLTIVVSIVANIVDTILGVPMLSAFVSLGLIIPSIAVTVRRLHDTDRSGWWILLPVAAGILMMVLAFGALAAAMAGGGGGFGGTVLIAFILAAVAFFTLLIFMILPGTPGPNRFGPDPYGEQNLGEVFA